MSAEEEKLRNNELKKNGYVGKSRKKKNHEDFWFIHDSEKQEPKRPSKKNDSQIINHGSDRIVSANQSNKGRIIDGEYHKHPKVFHDVYGEGSVEDIFDDKLTIFFKSGAIKRFHYPECKKVLKGEE